MENLKNLIKKKVAKLENLNNVLAKIEKINGKIGCKIEKHNGKIGGKIKRYDMKLDGKIGKFDKYGGKIGIYEGKIGSKMENLKIMVSKLGNRWLNLKF